MAGSSESTSTSRSYSDTYIPEYSESPFLRAVAEQALARSDQVYQWGMDQFNRSQGDIDGLMRDALSYASPQRIAVDMGMAEAGVQQAGERGRQSAIRDLESYGIDPSSGRYAALDSANRVMSAAAAAGAGNQQRMADQAAGNAMRNQAIAAGLQNRQFGLGVGDSANRLLQTASSLKYPPLGRFSTAATDSQSKSQQGDPASGGGVKSQPSAQAKPSGGGGGGQPKGGGGGKQPAGAKGKEVKPPPTEDKGRVPPGGKQTGTPTGGAGEKNPFGPDYDPTAGIPDPRIPFETGYPEPEKDYASEPPFEIGYPEDTTPKDYASEPPFESGYPEQPPDYASEPPLEAGYPIDYSQEPPLEAGYPEYDPYAGQTLAGDPFGANYDPTAGIPQAGDEAIAAADPAGALYAQEAGGGWGGADYFTQAGYEGPTIGGTDEWSDIGQGTMDTGAFDSTYDDFTDYGSDITGGYEDTGAFDPVYDDFTDYGGDVGDEGGGYEDYGGFDYGDAGDYGDDYDFGDAGDYYDDFTDYGDFDDDSYYDDFTDYGDAGDYGDYGDESDYYDDSYDASADDYGYDDSGDYGDYGDDSDYYDDSGSDDSDYEAYDDFSDYDTGSDDSSDYDPGYDDSGDSGGDDYEYARGGPVRRREKMARGPAGRPPPMRTGFRQRPRPPGFQRGGPMPQQRRQLDPPKPMPGRQRPMGPPPSGPPMPGNFISPNGMQPPAAGGMPAPGGPAPMPRAAPQIRPARPRPQHFAGGGQAGQRAEPTAGGFVSRELSPSAGSKVDDVNARLNAGEFVIPKDVAQWKGKEFFYKMIAQARKLRAGGDNEKPKVGYQTGGTFNPMQTGQPLMSYQTPAQIPQMPQMPQRPMARGMRR